MFDREMQEEYLFLSYLLPLIPAEREEPIDLEGKLKLEYYKLQKTFEGAIELDTMDGMWVPAKQKGEQGKQKKSTLDEIIYKINQKYSGKFTDSDRVVVDVMHDKLKKDQKLIDLIKTTDPKIFVESIFPAIFQQIAMDCYQESQESYASLFEDKAKYKAIMEALAGILYREMKDAGKSDN